MKLRISLSYKYKYDKTAHTLKINESINRIKYVTLYMIMFVIQIIYLSIVVFVVCDEICLFLFAFYHIYIHTIMVHGLLKKGANRGLKIR